MMNLLIASNNKHKVIEIKTALKEHFDSICSLEEDGIMCEPNEAGGTFKQNALIKAQTVAKLSDKIVLADDTGLCVEALGGRPGVFSARYANRHDDSANRLKLLDELKGVTDRRAHFETCVVLLYPDGKIIYGNGRVDGFILTEERGERGFGYDCIFFCPELNKTFAQANEREKLSVSHRGRALKDLLSKIQ